MGVQINISNKAVYFLAGLLILIIVAGVGVAFVGDAPNPGHLASEIQKCADDEILKMDGTDWKCAYDNSGNAGNGCVTTVGPASADWKGCFSVSMMADGENVCADGDGCGFYIIKFNDKVGLPNYGKIVTISRDSDGFLYQYPDGSGDWEKWTRQTVVRSRTNGDGDMNLLQDGNGWKLVDDMVPRNCAEDEGYEEDSINEFSFHDGLPNFRFEVTVCDNGI